MVVHGHNHDGMHDSTVPSGRGATSDQPDAQRSRRSHKKSRNGCQYCKRRRIKCDENKPACGNCSRLSLRCTYVLPGSQPEETPELEVRKRGRPRKKWTVVAVTRNGPSTSAATEPTATTLPPTSLTPLPAESSAWHVEKSFHLPWDAEDLELFFHYLGEVCAGLAGGDTQLWKDRVPRLAFRRHGVLHLLLAVSALHLARREPGRARGLEERAEVHLAVGLRWATAILPSLGPENCAELYVATILVWVCNLAKRPGPRNLLLVEEGSEVAWLELFRGVRLIVETIGLPTVFAGELGPSSSEDAQRGEQGEVSHHHHDQADYNTGINWEDALGRLSALVSSSADESARGACQSALDMMTWCFQDTYGTVARPRPTVDAKFSTIMTWVYCLSDEFIGALKEKDPVSLVLLAHFTVLLQTLDATWFMRGWAAHVLRGVHETLGPTWNEWLQWPALQIKDTGALTTTH